VEEIKKRWGSMGSRFVGDKYHVARQKQRDGQSGSIENSYSHPDSKETHHKIEGKKPKIPR
jgi:hypothetical protein